MTRQSMNVSLAFAPDETAILTWVTGREYIPQSDGPEKVAVFMLVLRSAAYLASMLSR
jgi:hypothetical protein